MKIHAIYVRHFRGIDAAQVGSCGGLNVFIGKNNSGKSTLLAAIELAHKHLARGALAGPWSTSRPVDEFHDRNTSAPCQIGLELELTNSTNADLRSRLQADVPHLERPIDQIRSHDRIAVIVAGVTHENGAFLFLQQIGAGRLTVNGADSP